MGYECQCGKASNTKSVSISVFNALVSAVGTDERSLISNPLAMEVLRETRFVGGRC
ncbi:MAG: hypothetical protein QNJ74_24400 [Trichodesmium sp. MO_231.B1]|nr:hypothetical protein [Trichodesmium sp. MO_231.B1]